MDAQTFATKDDIKHLNIKIDEAVDAILVGMQTIANELKTEIMTNRKEIKINRKDMQKIKTEFNFMRDDIKGLEGELAKTPTRAELTKLQSALSA